MSNIYTAVNEVMAKVGYVQKTGEMTYGQRYKYASETDLIYALRPAMIEAGIVVYPSGIKQLNQDDYTTAKGAFMMRDTIIQCFHFHHGESDTGFDVEVIGQADDTGSKSAYKAMTGALKYALRQTFVIETGNDLDSDPSPTKQPTVKATSNGKPKDKPILSVDKFMSMLVQTVGRIDNVQQAKATVKLLGYDAFPVVGDDARERQEAIYKHVKAYATLRDAGMNQEASLDQLANEATA